MFNGWSVRDETFGSIVQNPIKDMSMKTSLNSALIRSIHLSRLSKIWPSSLAGMGAILALHRVRPAESKAFEPNLTLEITPEFLDQTIRQIRELGLEIISLDEVHRRLTAGHSSKRFVCFTLDDGYADNYQYAAPIFEAYQVPYAIYATTGFLDRTALFWWILLEEGIRQETGVTVRFKDAEEHRSTVTIPEKTKAFADFHRLFRRLPAKDCLDAAKRFADDYAIDPEKLCADQSMTWDMAREIVGRGFGTIEAHTVTHLALSRQEPDEIADEMNRSCSRIEEQTGYRPKHFAYPFGDARAADTREFDIVNSLPILTATTTREGMLLPRNRAALTALPRLTLNGYYQSTAYVDVFMSGIGGFISRSLNGLKASH